MVTSLTRPSSCSHRNITVRHSASLEREITYFGISRPGCLRCNRTTSSQSSSCSWLGESHAGAGGGGLTRLQAGDSRSRQEEREGKSGRTPLHYAIESRNATVILFLLEDCPPGPNGLQLETTTYSGFTAYQLAACLDASLAHRLAEKGALALNTPDLDSEVDSDFDEDELLNLPSATIFDKKHLKEEYRLQATTPAPGVVKLRGRPHGVFDTHVYPRWRGIFRRPDRDSNSDLNVLGIQNDGLDHVTTEAGFEPHLGIAQLHFAGKSAPWPHKVPDQEAGRGDSPVNTVSQAGAHVAHCNTGLNDSNTSEFLFSSVQTNL
uniref:Uncharacterized protein n=1 Tax=Timema shepardi TaxID=629360 RepID=A0A7R9G1T8_TIMSH|nr:unnamed protein product [Timema shepardi]